MGSIRSLLDESTLQRIANEAGKGVTEQQVEDVLNAVLPTIEKDTASGLLATRAVEAQQTVTRAGARAGGMDLLSMLLGANASTATQTAAGSANVSSGTAGNILKIAAPILIYLLLNKTGSSSQSGGGLLGSLLSGNSSGGGLLGSLLGGGSTAQSTQSQSNGSLLSSLLGGGSSQQSGGGSLLGSLLGGSSSSSAPGGGLLGGLTSLLSDDTPAETAAATATTSTGKKKKTAATSGKKTAATAAKKPAASAKTASSGKKTAATAAKKPAASAKTASSGKKTAATAKKTSSKKTGK